MSEEVIDNEEVKAEVPVTKKKSVKSKSKTIKFLSPFEFKGALRMKNYIMEASSDEISDLKEKGCNFEVK